MLAMINHGVELRANESFGANNISFYIYLIYEQMKILGANNIFLYLFPVKVSQNSAGFSIHFRLVIKSSSSA